MCLTLIKPVIREIEAVIDPRSLHHDQPNPSTVIIAIADKTNIACDILNAASYVSVVVGYNKMPMNRG